MKIALLLALITFGGYAIPGTAEEPEVLEGAEITESKLIDALSPKEGVRTRSFKPRPDQPGAAQKLASVSMLITFHTDSTVLTDDAKVKLDELGRALNDDRLKKGSFIIEGHADPTGGRQYNKLLSQARAQAVTDYLVQNHHIDGNRLEPIGKGDQELLNKKNLTDPRNRRVTIVEKSRSE